MDKDRNLLSDDMDERIELFLRGNMSIEDEIAFKNELKNNSVLRGQVMTMVALVKGLETHESKTEQKIIDSVGLAATNKNSNNKTHNRSISLWWCSAAAVCAIFFCLFKSQQYKTLDSTLSPYYVQYDINDISRGEVDTVTVFHLYSLFNEIPRQRNVARIIKELEVVYASLDTDYTYYPYANDIAWNLSLAYIKDNQIKKAVPILSKLKEDNLGTPIGEKADKLLKKIRDM
jgi:hypothetical protein